MANINKSLKEIDLMIESEYNKAKKAIALKKELEALNEEEARLKKELGVEKIDEVEVGGRKSGSEWYQKDVPVSKFEKIGSHLKEMEGLEDMDAEDMDMGMDTEEVSGYFEEKLAELGRELDTKLSKTEEEDDIEDNLGDEVDDLEGEMGGMEDNMDDMEDDMGDDMIDEKEDNSDAPEVLEIDANGIIDEEETVEEQAGETLVSKADKKIKGDDGMSKVDNKNPMADKMYEGEDADEAEDLNESANAKKELVTEAKETDSSVLMEGLSDREQAKLKEELARMKSLMKRR